MPTENVYKRLTLDFTILCPQPYLLSYDEFGHDIAGKKKMFHFPIAAINPIRVISSGKDAVCNVGDTAYLKVEAQGKDLKYKWYSLVSNEWKEVTSSGYNTDTLSIKPTSSWGKVSTCRCEITDANGKKAITEEVSLYVNDGVLSIINQPKNVSKKFNTPFSFEVLAKGDGLTYQWYTRKKGSSAWASYPITTNVANFSASNSKEANDGMQVKCVVLDNKGNSVESEIATYTFIYSDIEIMEQPTTYYGQLGETAEFRISAMNVVSREWMYTDDEGKTLKETGNYNIIIEVPITEETVNRYYVCKMIDHNGKEVYSNFVGINFVPMINISKKDVGKFIKDYGLVFSSYDYSSIVPISNDGDVETYFRIEIKANGPVVNPKIVKDDVFIRIMDEMTNGDIIEIDLNNKPPTVKKNGLNIIGRTDRLSSFIQMKLDVGESTISYTADDGDINMSVKVYFNKRYGGI